MAKLRIGNVQLDSCYMLRIRMGAASSDYSNCSTNTSTRHLHMSHPAAVVTPDNQPRWRHLTSARRHRRQRIVRSPSSRRRRRRRRDRRRVGDRLTAPALRSPSAPSKQKI